MTQQESTALLHNGTFTHRVDGQKPIEYDIEGLNMNNCSESRIPRPHYERQNTFKLYKDWCLTINKVYFMMPRDTQLLLSI